MGKPVKVLLQQGIADASQACRDAARVMKTHGPNQIQFWFIALAIGIAAGFAAVIFRLGIYALQTTAYGTDDVLTLHSFAAGLAWYQILLIPICGGLIVGLILDRFTDDGRVRSGADVIEGAALSAGRVGVRRGLASAAASMIAGWLIWPRRSGCASCGGQLDGRMSMDQCQRDHRTGLVGLCCRCCGLG